MAFIEHQSEAHVLFDEASQEDKEYFLKLRNLILNPAALANAEIVAQHKELISSGLSLANREATGILSLRKDFFYAMFLYCVRENNIVIGSKSSTQEEEDLECLIKTAAAFDQIREQVSETVAGSKKALCKQARKLGGESNEQDLESCVFAAVGIDILGTVGEADFKKLSGRVDELAESALIRFIVLKSCSIGSERVLTNLTRSYVDGGLKSLGKDLSMEQVRAVRMRIKTEDFWYCFIHIGWGAYGLVTEILGEAETIKARLHELPEMTEFRSLSTGFLASVMPNRHQLLVQRGAEVPDWDPPGDDPPEPPGSDDPEFDLETFDLEDVLRRVTSLTVTDDELFIAASGIKNLGFTLEECEKVLRELSVTDEIITKFIEVFNQAVPRMELDDILNEFGGIFGETNFERTTPAHWILRHYPYGDTPFDDIKVTLSDYDLKRSLYRLWNPMECADVPSKIPERISARISRRFRNA